LSTLNAASWLDTWEQGLGLPPALRAAALLAPLLPSGLAEAERLALGRRDAYLMDLYAALFGPQLAAVTACPRCDERLEVALSIADLRVRELPPSEPSLALECEGYRVVYRLPNSLDLAAVAQATNLAQAREDLIARCVEVLELNGTACALSAVPAHVLERLAETMAELDPQASTELALACASCEHTWSDIFDVGAYLLESLEHWAERSFDQVHVLARAYGWSEHQILSLSAVRRARYLARVLA
jgi:hypothetical protein